MERRDFLKTTILTLSRTLSGVSQILPDQSHAESGDGYIRRENSRWMIGTSLVEKTIVLDRGRFALGSFRNKNCEREYVQNGVVSDEVRFTADAREITGSTGEWTLLGEHSYRLPQGELQLDLTLRHGPLEVTKHYVVYPTTPIIREWVTISNVSEKEIQISSPSFLECHLLSKDVDHLELFYMTGGGAYNGSQLLKTDRMTQTYSRMFDSKDASDVPGGGGYSAHLPLLGFHNRDTKDGVMIGWDYLGHWTLRAGNYGGSPVNLSLSVGGYSKELKPAEVIETPKAFIGVYTGDIDVMGNLILDWQYAYMWEFTNPDFFAKTRWGIDFPLPWVGAGGTPCGDNWGKRLALDLRHVDLMREAGGDILWDDAGWYDKWGSWNGPDWKLTTSYLAKHGMRWVLWYPTFLATRDSKVGLEHPEWLIPGADIFEQSIKATADWQADLLDKSVAAWGDFQWRYDAAPAVSADETGYLQSDQNFRSLMRRFKETHKESGIDTCSGGGRWISYDLARLSDSGEYTDGGVGPYSNYYTSLLVPPDKLHNVTDFWHIYYNPGSDRAHLCMDPCWSHDPGDGPDVEAVRKDWDLYHYLVSQGVAGRWSHVFRPTVANDDPIWYFQRMNRDGSKGVIITKHAKTGPTYYLITKPVANERSVNDSYYGAVDAMCAVLTTEVAAVDTGIYQDPTDGRYGFYGVSGEVFGPLNFKYQSGSGEASYVTSVVSLGGGQSVKDRFFGMAIQMNKDPIILTHLGLYAGGSGRDADSSKNIGRFSDSNSRGTYSLMVVRAEDGAVLTVVDLDMREGLIDLMGFKYARLHTPLRLDPAAGGAVVIKPKGLIAEASYDVRCAKSSFHTTKLGRDLMEGGIEVGRVEAGELVFLNLPNHPGSGSDKVPPGAPSNVTKRLGTNLGVQGIEIAWLPGKDNNWVSYYEVARNGSVIGKAAKGCFFFDYKGNARSRLSDRYEVRTVDGAENRSPLVLAKSVAGDPETYEALGGFSSTQGGDQWKYEESVEEKEFRELRWECGGDEGSWVGSGLGRIGRIWMQPGAGSSVARTFVVAKQGRLRILGSIHKDPSAENNRPAWARILHNDRQIWPGGGWAEVPPFYSKGVSHQLKGIEVVPEDLVRFIVRRSEVNVPDPVIWNPRIVWDRAD